MSTNEPLRRRRGAVARSEALDAARALLLAGGPSAVTLKGVGDRMGVSHANLIHHFGSAAGLQGELMDRMVRDLAEAIAEGLEGLTAADWGQGRLIDVAFDAFDRGGASQLAAWMALARETQRAESFAGVVRDLADRIARLAGDDDAAREKARRVVLTVTYMAFADGLIGPTLSDMLGTPADAPRDLAML
ncbi:MAG: TetR/AcrR family transcriptional regulator, partial [Brevundimonas sp.]